MRELRVSRKKLHLVALPIGLLALLSCSSDASPERPEMPASPPSLMPSPGGGSAGSGDTAAPSPEPTSPGEGPPVVGGLSGGSSGNAGSSDAPSGGEMMMPGAESMPPPQAPAELVGWASVPGLGVPTTTGGQGGETVTASTAEQLLDFVARPEPLIIQLSGTISAPVVRVASNKTLIGLGSTATLQGGLRIRGQQDEFVSNVIVQNLTIEAATSEVDGDGVQIHYAHHVWVDHCLIQDASDGNLDVVHGSDFVTVSFNKFQYTAAAPAADHRFSSLIGHSDSDSAVAEDTGHLKVTFHHNWWADNVIERMPRVRFGDVHVFNNYYSSAGNNYAIRAARNSRVLVETNYFDGVNTPHETNNDEDGAAQILARDNVYDTTTGAQTSTGAAFTPGYEYTLDAAAGVPALVRAQAGPR